MCINCRRPINCYNDKTRYKTMIALYIIDSIIFIIRLALVSNDISKKNKDTISFLIPIILFDLIASIPIIICNIIYIILRHCVEPLVHKNSSFKHLWRIATMTCIRLQCHQDRPQAILLIRIIFIVINFILKFISFIIGGSCSAKFKSECTAYTVIAAFGLLSTILIIIVEFVHFFRLWKYNPLETRNVDDDNRVHNSYSISGTKITKTHRRHLGFIHYSLLNDQNSDGFGRSICEKGKDCDSKNLHHILFYHSIEAERDISSEMSKEKSEIPFIAFYQTTLAEALTIAEKGFPYGNDNKGAIYKDYLHLKKEIFFTSSATQNLSTSEAIICVRLHLGHIISVITDGDEILKTYFGRGNREFDTIYMENKRRIYVRMPAQIEKWIIAIKEKVLVTDKLDGSFYEHCFK